MKNIETFLKSQYNKYLRNDGTELKFELLNVSSFIFRVILFLYENFLNYKIENENITLDYALANRNKPTIMSLRQHLKNIKHDIILVKKRNDKGTLVFYKVYIVYKEGNKTKGLKLKVL